MSSGRISYEGKIAKVLLYVALIILAISVVLPVGLLFLNSVKSNAEVRINILGWPEKFHFENFVEAWKIANYTVAFKNSLIVTGSTILIVCLIAGLAAYALSRLRVPGADAVLVYFLSVMALPAFLYIVPLFFLWKELALLDSLLGIIIIYSALFLPFSVFLLRAFMLSLPTQLEDAARIDGCSEMAVFTRIILPLSKPAFLAVAVIVGMWAWNEFLFAITFLHDPSIKTAPIKYYAFVGRFHSNLSYINATAFLLILPIMTLYIFLQKHMMQGMTSGAFKG